VPAQCGFSVRMGNRGTFRIRYTVDPTARSVSFTLRDLRGREVWSRKINDASAMECEAQVNGAGIYVLHMEYFDAKGMRRDAGGQRVVVVR
ncbi:MAG TPA: hypothetical protein VHV83_06840, partial [Armatimonadota bacterium]|nr:hypothetical protein [Armatimonadota bacterium]